MASEYTKSGLGALLFDGFRIPLLLNLYGTMARLETALGMTFDETAEKAYGNIHTDAVLSFTEPGVYRDITLSDLPLLKYHEHDTSPAVSMGCVITCDGGIFNSGIYRIEVISDKKAIVHCKNGSGLSELIGKSADGLPVTAAVGCSPALVYVSACALAADTDELKLASVLGCREFIKTENHPVPADTQVIIQGRIGREKALGGQFFNHRCRYTEREPFPLMEIDSVRIADGGVFQSTVIGEPPMEDAYLGIAAARMQFHRIRAEIPEVTDIKHPAESVFGIKAEIYCSKITDLLKNRIRSDFFYGKFDVLEFF